LPAQKTSAAAKAPGALEAQDEVFARYREGRLSGRRFDPTASDGAVSYAVGATHEWALQWRYSAALFNLEQEYELWAAVRILSPGEVAGQGLTCGVYCVPRKAGKSGASLTGKACRPGVWQWLKVGRIVPEAGDYVWFAPTSNPEVTEIQVDRILMIPTPPK
jgi:hypothetical protein